MTLKHARPATINSTKLCAVVLIGIGIAVFAYLLAEQGELRRPPAASTIAWTGGLVLLAVDGRKRRVETPRQPHPALAPQRSPARPGPAHKAPVHPSRLLALRRKAPQSADHLNHKSSAPEYTLQSSHF